MRKILLFTALLFSSIMYSQTTDGNGDWSNTGIWDNDQLPATTDNVVIAHSVDIDNSRTVADLTINAGARLDIDGALTVTGTLTNNGTLNVRNADLTHSGTTFTNTGIITISAGKDMILSNGSATLTNSATISLVSSNTLFAGLMLSGTYTKSGNGLVQYTRYIASSTYWDLIGSPVTNLLIEDFEDSNDDIANNGTAMAIGTYTNTSEAYSSNAGWTNYTTSTVGAAGNFVSGKGYQMATTNGSDVIFSGEMNDGNVAITVTTNEEGTVNPNDGTKFELIANPYPSYVDVTSFINAHKDTQLHADHAAVYGWDGAQYDTYSLASPGNGIAPAQGFMIGVRGSDGTSQTITFTTAMQTASGSGDYSEQDPMEDDRAELFINLNQNDFNKETKLFFLEQGTDGLDVGYDAATMDLGNYSVYSRLVADDEGVNMDHQSLAYSEMWNNKVIPLGVNALAGEEITLGISHRTTPADLNIYLEDAIEGTMTDIKAGDYTITPSSDINGVGRFFIHMTADTMSNGEVSTSLLNAYKDINANHITLEGLATQSNNINVSLYNILGRKVLDTSLNNNVNTQTISTLGMASGIYVIELESGNDRLTKKLIIQ